VCTPPRTTSYSVPPFLSHRCTVRACNRRLKSFFFLSSVLFAATCSKQAKWNRVQSEGKISMSSSWLLAVSNSDRNIGAIVVDGTCADPLSCVRARSSLTSADCHSASRVYVRALDKSTAICVAFLLTVNHSTVATQIHLIVAMT
jgi:hypothetical protein